MIQIVPIPALKDNYIWLIKNAKGDACLVDPGDALPALEALRAHDLQLKHILITHHHWDHVDGIPELLEAFPSARVIGPINCQNQTITQRVRNGELVTLDGLDIKLNVLAIPGHTIDHVAYYNDSALFSGDMLFSCGCGRVFEGTYNQMYHSLMKLKNLSDDLMVYCGHEYTLKNIEFAELVDPKNEHLEDYKEQVVKLRNQGLPSLPATMLTQKQCNPFLRCKRSEIIKAAVAHDPTAKPEDPVSIFKAIRKWKDSMS